MSAPASHLPERDHRDALLIKYHPLICGCASHWHAWNPSVQIDDLIQEGRIALLRAHEMYDSAKGATFLTYARRRILADMRTHVANTRDTIRIPSDHFRKIRVSTCSLDLPVEDDDGAQLALIDIIAGEQREPQLSDDAALTALVMSAVEKLPPSQRTVVRLLYLIPEPASRKGLGAFMGITRQAVELRLKKALRSLRKSYTLKGAA